MCHIDNNLCHVECEKSMLHMGGCGWFFDIFNRCPENENMQNVIPFPFDVYDALCGMMRWCWRRRRPWWWKCNVQNIIYSNTVFVYKSAVMCHFHGNHVSNSPSLSLTYFHYANWLIRFIGDHCQSLLIEAKCVYGRIINFRIFVIFFLDSSKQKETLFILQFLPSFTVDVSELPGVLWKILSTASHFQIFIGNTF